MNELCPSIWGITASRSEQTVRGEASLPALPRLRWVLESLLTAESPKQTALGLNLSLQTIYQYQKLLYRRLNVSGRSELLAAFVRN